MLKSLQTIIKQDKEKFKVPKGVQDVIPIRTIWENGIFLVGNNKYSKTFRFTDINYEKASEENQKSMFLAYSALLNSLDSNSVSVVRKNYEDAKSYFTGIADRVETHLKKLGSHFSQPTAVERLQTLHGFYRHGEEAEFHFDLKENRKLGHSFKDYICPDSM